MQVRLGMASAIVAALVFGVISLAVVTAPSALSAQGRAALVGVDDVRREPVAQTFPLIGRLVARRAGVIAARVRAPVAEMRVEVGDRVAAGEVLAVLVDDRLRWQRELRAADVAAAEADVQTREQQYQMAAQELRRQQRLKDNSSAAFQQARFDDQTIEVGMMSSGINQARARLKEANANLRLTELDLRDSQVRAPYPGVVTIRHIEAGAFVSVGDTIVTLVDDTVLEVEADVPADRIAGLMPGTPVVVEIADKTVPATVRALIPEENALTRTRAVRFTVELDTANDRFATNQSVSVAIPIGAAREVVSVHKDAVLNRRGQNLVYVVADGIANARTVQLGEAVGGRFEVLDGLQPGEKVVVRGNERLQPGQKVRF